VVCFPRWYIKDVVDGVMDDMPRYEVVDYLIEKGFEATIAEKISEELGVEMVEDLPLIREQNILKLNFLTPKDKDTLWHLVTASFEKLSLSEKEEIYKNRQQLHSGTGAQIMKVIINLISYEQPEFEVQTTTTISELKKLFEDDFGIPMQNFILKYKGQTLEDKMTLADYNIPDKGILDIEGNLISTLRPRYVNGHKDGLNSSGMTHEAGLDIKTMLDLLQQHSHLGAPNDTSTLDSGFWARQNRYWGDLKRLRSDIKSLEAKLLTVEKEKKDALAQAYKATVERDKALEQLGKLKADVAREKAIKEAQERAVTAAAQQRAATEAAAVEEKRRKDLEYIEEAHKRAEKQRADREEAKAKAEAEKSPPETEEDKRKREAEERRWAYMVNRHNGY
jgi:hypothetical protein